LGGFEVHGVVLCEKISCCLILIDLKGEGRILRKLFWLALGLLVVKDKLVGVKDDPPDIPKCLFRVSISSLEELFG